MKRPLIYMLLLFCAQFGSAQQLGTYLFARAPRLVDYELKTNNTSHIQGLSAGVGFTHHRAFLELGSFIYLSLS